MLNHIIVSTFKLEMLSLFAINAFKKKKEEWSIDMSHMTKQVARMTLYSESPYLMEPLPTLF